MSKSYALFPTADRLHLGPNVLMTGYYTSAFGDLVALCINKDTLTHFTMPVLNGQYNQQPAPVQQASPKAETEALPPDSGLTAFEKDLIAEVDDNRYSL